MEPTWNSLTSDIVTNNQDQKIGTENVSLNAFMVLLKKLFQMMKKNQILDFLE